MKNIVFRVDASVNSGLGHLTRSITIAEIIKDSFNLMFVCHNINDNLKNKIEKVTKNIIEIPTTYNYDQDFINFSEHVDSESIIVLDGYCFDTNYQIKCKKIAYKVIFIDDQNDQHFYSDAVINHILGMNKKDFSKENYTKLYLGTDYAILRKSFLNEAKKEINELNFRRLFINMGGSDINDVTSHILLQCLKLNYFSVINVVTGSFYKNKDYLEKLIQKHSNIKINLYSDLDEEKLCDVIRDSGVAICPVSTISYEVCCFGIFLITGYISESQKRILSFFEKEEICYSLGNLTEISFSKIDLAVKQIENLENRMVTKQKYLFNKNQKHNILEVFNNL